MLLRPNSAVPGTFGYVATNGAKKGASDGFQSTRGFRPTHEKRTLLGASSRRSLHARHLLPLTPNQQNQAVLGDFFRPTTPDDLLRSS